MATKKKKPEEHQEEPAPQIPEITLADLEAKFMEGQEIGQQAVYKIILEFIGQRMINHFQAKNDELAKELREIYSLIKENVKNP